MKLMQRCREHVPRGVPCAYGEPGCFDDEVSDPRSLFPTRGTEPETISTNIKSILRHCKGEDVSINISFIYML